MTMLATAPVLADDDTRPGLRGPDPQVLRAVPTEPPYDAPAPADPPTPLTLRVRRIHGSAVLDLPDLADDGVVEDVWTPEADGDSRALEADLRRLFGRRRTARSELPAPGPRAAAAVRMLLEVLTGDRPSRQVAGWVSPRVLEGLENRSPRQHRSLPRRPVLRSLRVCEPADGVAEVCAVVLTGERHRAVALRMDGLDGRWTVTALHVG